MSFKNFLDLRKKPPQKIQIIEKIILQKRSLKSDFFLTLSVIFVASGIIWGVSKADNLASSFVKPQIKNFSASGIVLDINESNLLIDQAKGSDDLSRTNYTFNLLDNPKIETDNYVPLSVSDIQVGTKVVVQGKIDGGNITIKRIIYFGNVAPKETTATSTETSTEISTASSTEEIPSATASTLSSSSTLGDPSVYPSNSSGIVESILDAAKETVSGIVDSIIGTTSTTSITSTDTDNQTKEPEPEFPGVPDNDNSSAQTENSTTSPSIIETISDTISNTIDGASETVKDTIDTIIEIVTKKTEEGAEISPTNNQEEALLETASSTEQPSQQ